MSGNTIIPDLPPPARTVWAHELPQPTGTPADRATLRASMPCSRQLIEDYYCEFGGLDAVVAAENGYVYKWSR